MLPRLALIVGHFDLRIKSNAAVFFSRSFFIVDLIRSKCNRPFKVLQYNIHFFVHCKFISSRLKNIIIYDIGESFSDFYQPIIE